MRAHPNFRRAVLLTALAWSVAAHAMAQEGAKRVLVIHGTADIGIWEVRFNEVFLRSVVAEPNTRVSLEFIEVDVDSAELAVLAESVRMRNVSMPTDLVVSVQPAAGRFLHRWGHVFAPEAQRLYALPASGEAEAVKREDSGVVLETALTTAAANTLDAMPQLLPELERLYVVAGASASDAAYMNRIRDAVDRVGPALEIIYLLGVATENLVDILNTAPSNSAVLVATYDVDPESRLWRTTDVAALLSERTSVPIFGLIDSVIGVGSVGGNITSASLYAEVASRVTLDVLAGRTPDATTPPTAWVFDAEQLARFDIPTSRLPKGSQVINEVPSPWTEYAPGILAGLAIMLAQAVLIAKLLRTLRERQRAERERDQQSLGRENQMRLFESVVNAISDAFIVFGVDGTIVTGNHVGFRTTFGSRIADFIGQPAGRLFVPAGTECGLTLESLLAPEPRIRSFYRADGSEFAGEYYGTAITDVAGRTTGYFVLVRDVTDRLAREEARSQARKMQALGTLAGGIAHDFNNILMAIAGSAELVTLGAEDAAATRSQVAKILTATDRATKLIRQILLFSRHDEDESHRPIDLGELLRESMSLLDASLPKGVKMHLAAASDLWVIQGNPTHIQQAIMNLCSNCVYAMDEHGEIAIAATNRSLVEATPLFRGEALPGDYVVLSVSDTGSGIPEGTLRRVFEPFFTTKPRGKGTGLGLSLVYGTAQAHGGYVDLRSTVGRGTTVTLYLPAAKRLGRSRPLDESTRVATGTGQRVLLVDDECLVADTNASILRHLGYTVECFSNPLEAIQRFEAGPSDFDIVVSDQSMPELDGVRLLERVARLRPEIPKILCTGYLAAETQAEAAKLGFSVLAKPCRIAELSRAVSAALASSSLRGDAEAMSLTA